MCWICLDLGGELVYPCRCPRMAHKACLARWQLQSAGTRKETHCEFCDSVLPDWKHALTGPKATQAVSAPAIMNVNFDGKTYSFEVEPGPDGYRKFTEAIRMAFELPDDSELNITFTCDEPTLPEVGSLLTLQGPGAYDAAVHCASLSAARRLSNQGPTTPLRTTSLPVAAVRPRRESSAASAEPPATASRQPVLPQRHGSSRSVTRMWPMSPAEPCAPRWRRPSAMMPQPIIHAVAFDPDGWKRVSLDMVREAKVNLRTHSWFSGVLREGGKITGVIAQTKLGRQAIRAKYVVDATGDLDVGVSAGAEYIDGQYIVTTVFRMANVDTEKAIAFEFAEPEEYKKLDRQARRVIGGAWGMWWLKTPLPGIVWCNCPHMPGYDGLSVESMVESEVEGRERMMNLYKFAKENIPGFENAEMLGAAEQMGIRQTRLLQGEYVVNKDDVKSRRYFEDTVCRGRDYYTPYRALLPKGIDNLIVAGRHYSVESDAQKLSREIPPCQAQGEAAGVAVSLALNGDLALRNVDHKAIQKQMRAQGADPGDKPSPNALIENPVAAEERGYP